MTDDEIRDVVLEHMRNHKITKADLARKLGITPSAVWGVLDGRTGKIPSSLSNVLAAAGLELVVAPKSGGKEKL